MNSILLVEDDTGIASFMKLELTHEGYSVDTAEDGRSGLELFEAKQYQLVLLDIMLPVLNGIEVLRRIRKYQLSRSYWSPPGVRQQMRLPGLIPVQMTILPNRLL